MSDKKLECPECAGSVELKADTMEGEIVQCGDCGVELEVTKGDSAFALQPAPEEEEDWGE